MSRREKVTDAFTVRGDDGNEYQVTETTTFETGRLIDGGEMPTAVRYTLQDGTMIEALLGNQQFIDRRNGRAFKKT